MDDKGNIREFTNEDEAIKAGFKEQLSVLEKEALEKVKRNERHDFLKKMRMNTMPEGKHKTRNKVKVVKKVNKNRKKMIKLSKRKNRR